MALKEECDPKTQLEDHEMRQSSSKTKSLSETNILELSEVTAKTTSSSKNTGGQRRSSKSHTELRNPTRQRGVAFEVGGSVEGSAQVGDAHLDRSNPDVVAAWEQFFAENRGPADTPTPSITDSSVPAWSADGSRELGDEDENEHEYLEDGAPPSRQTIVGSVLETGNTSRASSHSPGVLRTTKTCATALTATTNDDLAKTRSAVFNSPASEGSPNSLHSSSALKRTDETEDIYLEVNRSGDHNSLTRKQQNKSPNRACVHNHSSGNGSSSNTNRQSAEPNSSDSEDIVCNLNFNPNDVVELVTTT